jgi:hypothetical protein
MRMKPIVHDLYCGLGGWAEGFLSENYEVIGYDIEKHDYGTGIYPGTLIICDVRSIHGSQCKDATVIVASPPCQEPSYRAMPWSRAKALNAIGPPHNFIELFNACFRIQRESSEAAGHYIPLIVENVCGAQRWVGRARWHFGAYYLWGDVPALMPITTKQAKISGQNWSRYTETGEVSPHWRMQKNDGGSWFNVAHNTTSGKGQNPDGRKTHAHLNQRNGECHTRHLTNPSEHGTKFSQSGDAWFDGKPRDKMLGHKGPAAHGSKSRARARASAEIAKIPFPLAQHIARCFKPRHLEEVRA